MTLDGVAERGGAVSADGVRESVSEEVTFEQRSERGGGAAMQRTRGRVCQAGETASATALRQYRVGKLTEQTSGLEWKSEGCWHYSEGQRMLMGFKRGGTVLVFVLKRPILLLCGQQLWR